MHKIKNKRLLSIFMAGIISYTCLDISKIYANENNKVDTSIENTTNEDENSEESLEINLKDINDINNMGLRVKTQGNIIKIEEDKIYITDDSGEGIVYLNNIEVNNLKVGDTISVIGVISVVEDINVITVDDVKNIDLVLSEDNLDEENKEEGNKEEGNKEEGNKEEGNKGEGNKGEDSENINGDENNKPTTNNPTTNNPTINNPTTNTSATNIPSNNQSKPNNNVNMSIPSNNTNASKLEIEEVVINAIKGKEAIVIEDDLTSEQWEKVKSNLEEGNIKVKDLKNNKIRITKVNKELGDKIWIVNDPRMLDTEESETTKNSIIDTIVYSEYDVSESKWNSIVEDVENNNARIKYDSEKNIKVIYQKTDTKDYTITLNRIDNL